MDWLVGRDWRVGSFLFVSLCVYMYERVSVTDVCNVICVVSLCWAHPTKNTRWVWGRYLMIPCSIFILLLIVRGYSLWLFKFIPCIVLIYCGNDSHFNRIYPVCTVFHHIVIIIILSLSCLVPPSPHIHHFYARPHHLIHPIPLHSINQSIRVFFLSAYFPFSSHFTVPPLHHLLLLPTRLRTTIWTKKSQVPTKAFAICLSPADLVATGDLHDRKYTVNCSGYCHCCH